MRGRGLKVLTQTRCPRNIDIQDNVSSSIHAPGKLGRATSSQSSVSQVSSFCFLRYFRILRSALCRWESNVEHGSACARDHHQVAIQTGRRGKQEGQRKETQIGGCAVGSRNFSCDISRRIDLSTIVCHHHIPDPPVNQTA